MSNLLVTIYKIFKSLLLSLLWVVLVFWLFSPILSRFALNSLLTPYQLALTDDTNIRINPVAGKLAIKDFTIVSKETTNLLHFDNLIVNVSLLQLFNNVLEIEHFSFSGLHLDASQQQDTWLISGVDVLALFSSLSKTELPSPPEQISDADAKPIKLQVEAIDFSELMVNLAINGQNIALKINQIAINEIDFANDQVRLAIDSDFNISIKDSATHQNIASNLTFKSDVNVNLKKQRILITNLSLNSDHDFSNSISTPQQHLLANLMLTSDIDFDVIGQHILISNLKVNSDFDISIADLASQLNLSSQLALESDLNVDLNKQQVHLTKLNINTENTIFSDDQWQVSLPSMSAESHSIMSILQPKIEVDALLDVRLNDLSVTPVNQQGETLKLNEFQLSKLDLKVRGTEPTIRFDELRLNQLEVMNSPSHNAVLQLDKLLVEQSDITLNSIAINAVTIGQFASSIVLNKTKQVANLVLPKSDVQLEVAVSEDTNPAEQQSPEETQEATATPANEFSIYVGQVRTDNINTIEFIDNSVSPTVNKIIRIEDFSISTLDVQQPDLVTQVLVQGKIDDFTTFKMNGELQPFFLKPMHKIMLNLVELNLADLSPYIAEALQYDINTGLLDMDLDLSLLGEDMNGDVDLILRGVDLSELDNKVKDNSIDSGVISFNIALGMLKDSDGNVELNVPIKGKTTDPNVGFSGVLALLVKRATMAAAKDYLITTFVPYAKVATLAMAAGSHLMKLKFNPIDFTATQTELSDEQKGHLHQLALLLNKHKDISVNLCSIGVKNDYIATEQTLSPAEVEQTVLNLAKTRSTLVKTFLIEQEKIKSNRLLSCNPKIDENSSTPRLEITQR